MSNPEYSKGYAAGRRRKNTERERQAFRDRVFLTILPHLMNTPSGWRMDGKTVSTADERVELAWRFADKALARR